MDNIKNKVNEILSGTDFTSREDFKWGVNIHDAGYKAYPLKYLEDHLALAKRMGSRILRVGFSGYEITDKAVKLANAYDMDIMLCHYAGIRDSEENYDGDYWYNLYKDIVNHYNGKNGNGYIKYFNIDNEIDNYLLHESDVNYKRIVGNGSVPEQYEPYMLRRTAERFKNVIRGVRDADSDVKIVLNFCWEHYGMLEYMFRNGVDWDITGYDWYADMSRAYMNCGKSAFQAARVAYEKWRKDIIICETNAWSDERPDENDIGTWYYLFAIMKDAYQMDFVKGCIFYELIDETDFENGKYEREAHFGLIKADRDGNIGEPKIIYNTLKELFHGEDVEKLRLRQIENDI